MTMRRWGLGLVGALALTGLVVPEASGAATLRRVPLSEIAGGPGGVFDTDQGPFRWALRAGPGIITGAPAPEQVLLTATRAHRCRSLHVDFAAGGQAQSAALMLRRSGRPDLWAATVSDTAGALDARLDGRRSWKLAGATPAISIDVFVNGWALCAGQKGLRSTA